MMQKGILIIATGGKYRQMAQNLVASIKAAMPEMPVCVCSDSNDFGGAVVDEVKAIATPRNHYELKAYLDRLSPFKQTLYIDADSIVINPELFREMVAFAFSKSLAVMQRGEGDAGAWVDVKAARDKYKLKPEKPYPQLNTTVIAWKDTKANERLFDATRGIYADPMPHKAPGGFPDEAAFGLAMMKTGIYGKQGRYWEPAYYFEGVNHSAGHILKTYPILTLAGTVRNRIVENIYNGTAQKVGRLLGVPTFKMPK